MREFKLPVIYNCLISHWSPFVQKKHLACNPLPDVDRETDLNTFITQWRETEETDLKTAVSKCQIAENVIRSMQDKLGEAQAMYDEE